MRTVVAWQWNDLSRDPHTVASAHIIKLSSVCS